jgi:hypothetical protein
MPHYHKRKRRRFNMLKSMLITLLGVLGDHVEHSDKEHVTKFTEWLKKLYE